MNTFLPYPDYARSASVLDNKRLGKQRVECLQILQTLQLGPYHYKCLVHKQHRSATNFLCPQCGDANVVYTKTAWYSHPAVKMWREWQYELCSYGIMICAEWRSRGFQDSILDKIENIRYNIKQSLRMITCYPYWLTPDFCLSHQSNLLRKDPAFYRPIFGNEVPDDLPYIWPVK